MLSFQSTCTYYLACGLSHFIVISVKGLIVIESNFEKRSVNSLRF